MQMREMAKLIKEILLKDPLSGEMIKAFSIGNEGGLEFVSIPDRALDIYYLRYQGITISHTDYNAGISPRNFHEEGTEGFLRNFFVGFLTTCGLCNAGRPCREDGFSYGLHGCISNIPCSSTEIMEKNGWVHISGVIDEIHQERKIHMRLNRIIALDTTEDRLWVQDTIQNLSEVPQPYMMMYHINFGAPFLSEHLSIDADFSYIENRDTGRPEKKERLILMGTPGSENSESVYYTKADMKHGITLFDPKENIRALLCAEGHGLEWMGVWKNFLCSRYAIGIEPCVCPGLGRVNARKKGLLVTLLPNEIRKNTVSLKLQKQ